MNELFHTSKGKKRFLLVMLFIFLVLLVPGMNGHSDFDYWRNWSVFTYENGLTQAYLSGTDYLPVYQYVLWLYGLLQRSVEEVRENIYTLKAFTLLFDFWGLWLVYKWMGKKTDFLWMVLLCVFNISFIYNTLLWGQVDAILAALAFAAIYCAWKKQIILSCLLIVLALNFKLQAIIMIPLWGLLLLYALKESGKWKHALAGIGLALVLQVLIILPFIQTQRSQDHLYNSVFGSVDRYPYLSYFAYNFWCFVKTEPWWTPDKTFMIGPFNAKDLSFWMFAAASLVAMLPVMKDVWQKWTDKNKEQHIPREKVWLSGGLVVLLFFYLNTQMHERYSHPAFLFLIAYGFYVKDYIPLILFSIAYFLNMEDIDHWLQLNNYDTVLFDPKFVAGIYLVCIVYCFVRLYKLPVVKQAEITAPKAYT